MMFLGLSAILPIAMALACSSVGVCLCVFVHVRVCKNREHRSNLGENKKCTQIMFIDFDICNLPATMPVLYSVTLTYFFKVKYFT